MNLPDNGNLLRIYIGESDKYEGKHLYDWIVLRAREYGVAGATVIRGMMGYGANSRIKTTKILRLSQDLPIIIELVDTEEILKSFLATIDHAITEGLATYEKVNILFYRSSEE
jgi:PII-like signaling protein